MKSILSEPIADKIKIIFF